MRNLFHTEMTLYLGKPERFANKRNRYEKADYRRRMDGLPVYPKATEFKKFQEEYTRPSY